jgi:hypothetical protein
MGASFSLAAHRLKQGLAASKRFPSGIALPPNSEPKTQAPMGASFSLAAHRLKQGLAASGQRKTRQNLAGFWLLVIPARFERATVCLEGRCSIQLSYGTEGAKIGPSSG